MHSVQRTKQRKALTTISQAMNHVWKFIICVMCCVVYMGVTYTRPVSLLCKCMPVYVLYLCYLSTFIMGREYLKAHKIVKGTTTQNENERKNYNFFSQVLNTK